MFYLLISLCPLWLCVRHFGQVIGKNEVLKNRCTGVLARTCAGEDACTPVRRARDGQEEPLFGSCKQLKTAPDSNEVEKPLRLC